MSDARQPVALHAYRIVVWLMVAVAILVIVTRPFPPFPATEDSVAGTTGTTFLQEISEAASRFKLNESSADSAPQQQVLNGWLTNDLLTIIARENAATAAALTAEQQRWEWEMKDRRTESVIVILGLGATGHLLGSAAIGLIAALRRRETPTSPEGPPSTGPAHPYPAGQPNPRQPVPPQQWPTQPPSGFIV